MKDIVNKLNTFLKDRRNLVCFYMFGCLFVEFVLHNILGETDLYRMIFTYGFPILYYLWTVYIAVQDVIHHEIPRDRLMMVICLIFLLAFISWIFCPDGHSPGYLGLLVHQIMLSYVTFTMYSHYSPEENQEFISRFAKIFIAVIGIVNLLNLGMYATGKTDLLIFGDRSTVWKEGHLGGRGRYIGLYEYPTTAGYLSVASLLFSLYLCRKGKLNKGACAVSVFLSVMMVYMADARTSFIQCFIILICGLYFFLRKYFSAGKSAGSIAGFGVLNAGLLGFLFRRKIAAKIAEIAADPFNILNAYSTDRMKIWRVAINLIKERPLLGYGWFNNIPIVELAGYSHCHNIFIAMAYWMGIPGLIAYIAFFVLSAKELYVNRKFVRDSQSEWLIVQVICICFQSLLDVVIFGDLLRPENAVFWICFGYLIYGNKQIYGKKDLYVG